MSCIAGVGGDVEGLVLTAKSGRPVVVLDGCPLICARRCLQRHGIEPDLHLELSEHGVRRCRRRVSPYAFREPRSRRVSVEQPASETSKIAAKCRLYRGVGVSQALQRALP